LTLPVELVEFDVQRCGDGTLVCFHDDWLWLGDQRRDLADLTFDEFASRAPHYVRYDEVLLALVGRSRAHIALKFTDPDAVLDAVGRAVGVVGAEQMIVTTLDDRTVRVVRDWVDEQGLDLLVGLLFGRRVAACRCTVRSGSAPPSCCPGSGSCGRGPTSSWRTTPWPGSGSPPPRVAGTCRCWCGRWTPRTPCATGCAPAGPGWSPATSRPSRCGCGPGRPGPGTANGRVLGSGRPAPRSRTAWTHEGPAMDLVTPLALAGSPSVR